MHRSIYGLLAGGVIMLAGQALAQQPAAPPNPAVPPATVPEKMPFDVPYGMSLDSDRAKQIAEAPHETLLTVDATTGQNGLRQARMFSEAVDVTGLVLTKLDGTAKGGIALAIAHELGIPVKLIGVGEQLEDLRPFDPAEFARALVT